MAVTPRRSATPAMAGSCGQLPGAAAERRTKREVRHERDLPLDAQLEHVLAGAIHDAVGVLHLGDVDELERAADVAGAGLADADQVELALAAQILERAELLREEVGGRSRRSSDGG